MVLSGRVCGGWIFRTRRESFALPMAISISEKSREDPDGFHQDPFLHVRVPLNHAQVRMPKKRLDPRMDTFPIVSHEAKSWRVM